MLIPKSYLTTPKPPAWYYDYEKTVTHIDADKALNETLKHTVFTVEEIEKLNRTRDYVRRRIPRWVLNHPALVVAGGVWATCLQDELIKDIDIFVLRSSEATPEYISNIRNDMIKHYPDIVNKTDSYNRNNENVTEVWTTKDKFIQFIFTKHKTRKELIADFDYVHCKTSYWCSQLYITRKIYDAIMKRELIPQNTKNIQLWREEKFLSRGYKKMYKTVEKPPGTIKRAGAPLEIESVSYEYGVDHAKTDLAEFLRAYGAKGLLSEAWHKKKMDEIIEDYIPW